MVAPLLIAFCVGCGTFVCKKIHDAYENNQRTKRDKYGLKSKAIDAAKEDNKKAQEESVELKKKLEDLEQKINQRNTEIQNLQEKLKDPKISSQERGELEEKLASLLASQEDDKRGKNKILDNLKKLEERIKKNNETINKAEQKVQEKIGDHQHEVNSLQRTESSVLNLEDYQELKKIRNEDELKTSPVKLEIEKLLQEIDKAEEKFPERIKLKAKDKTRNCFHKNISWNDLFQKEKSKEPYCLDCGEDENKQGKMFEDIKDDFFVFQETNKLIEEYLLEFAKEEEQKTNRTPEEEQELENLRKKLRELEKSNLDLEGDLDLTDFRSLLLVDINGNPQLGKIMNKNRIIRLEIINCPKLEGVDCSENLITEFDFQNCPNLGALICNQNQLKELNLQSFPSLWKLECYLNFLTSLDLSQNRQLEILHIGSNNFPKQDLSFLNHLVNLKELGVGNFSGKERVEQGIYNHFVGSLELLKNMINLEHLDIRNTDLNSGIEYLPSSLKELGFALEEIKQWIEAGLKPDDYDFVNYLKKGGKLNPQEIDPKEVSRNGKLRKEYESLKSAGNPGLKPEESSLAKYLRDKKIKPRETILYIDELREELKEKNNQNYYHKTDDKESLIAIAEKRNNITKLDLDHKDLKEEINCSHNSFSNIILNKLPKLKTFIAQYCTLSKLTIDNCQNLQKINVSNNQLSELDFLQSCNSESLVSLVVNSNDFIFNSEKTNYFYGSFLEPLKDLTKLKQLNISNTSITQGKVADCSKIKEELKDYYVGRPDNHSGYNFQFLQQHTIFFNVRTNTFQGNLQGLTSLLQLNKSFLEQKEQKILLLESQIQELTNLVKNQKQKIVNAYLFLSSEKELLKELVTRHLEFTKFKSQEMNSSDYDEQCEEYEEKLELETKLNSKLLLLEEQKQLPQITIANNQGNVCFGSVHNIKRITESQELITQLTEKHAQLIAQQVINKMEELTEDTDKIFSTFEKPLLEKKIGQGGYGEVYLDHKERQEIKNEINILKKLRDRNIIQYYGVYYKEQEVLIIMDYAEQASGIAYIHYKDIIHCDLKSLNVLLTSGNQAKISDFGLAKIKAISSKDSQELKDIYAFGMVIWEITTKCTEPFKDVDDSVVYLHVINNGREKIPNDTPENIRDIIRQLNIIKIIDGLTSQIIDISHLPKPQNKLDFDIASKTFQNSIVKNKRPLSTEIQGNNKELKLDDSVEESKSMEIDNYN
ncbi:13873_t:CDS:10 [Funneliformis geosporum]|nr:13873_t:CDS:10 [Funneliformis geosporum]